MPYSADDIVHIPADELDPRQVLTDLPRRDRGAPGRYEEQIVATRPADIKRVQALIERIRSLEEQAVPLKEERDAAVKKVSDLEGTVAELRDQLSRLKVERGNNMKAFMLVLEAFKQVRQITELELSPITDETTPDGTATYVCRSGPFEFRLYPTNKELVVSIPEQDTQLEIPVNESGITSFVYALALREYIRHAREQYRPVARRTMPDRLQRQAVRRDTSPPEDAPPND